MGDKNTKIGQDDVPDNFDIDETSNWAAQAFSRMTQEVQYFWFCGSSNQESLIDDEPTVSDGIIEISFLDEESEEDVDFESEEGNELAPGETDSEGYTARERGDMLQLVAETIRTMRASDDPNTRRYGEQLHVMSNDSEQRALANAIILRLQEPERVNRFMAILNDPAQRNVADRLKPMVLDFTNSFTVASFMETLTGSNAVQRADAEQILAMLNSPTDSPLGLALLNGFNVGSAEMHTMLELLKDPAKRETARALRDLLTSPEEGNSRAGYHLLALLTSTDGSAQSAAQRLLSRLADPAKRASAITLASALNTPALILTATDIFNDPRKGTAAKGLLEMLQNPEQLDSAVALLELLGSRFGTDRQQGSKIIELLNDAEKAPLAKRLLNIRDVGHRNNIMQLFGQSGEAAVPRILDLYESPGRRDQRAYFDLQYYLDSSDSRERNLGRALIQRLANPAQASLTVDLLKQFQTTTELEEINAMITPENAATVSGMLNGSADDRRRLHAIVDLRIGGNSDLKVDGLVKKPSMDYRPPIDQRPTANRLFQMLTGTDVAARSGAQTLLDRVTNPLHIRPAVAALSDDKQRGGMQPILAMLTSNDYRDRNGANLVLQLMATDPPVRFREPFYGGGKKLDFSGGGKGFEGNELENKNKGVGKGVGKDIRDDKLPSAEFDFEPLKGPSPEQVRAARLIAALNDPARREETRNLLRVVDSKEELSTLDSMSQESNRRFVAMLTNPAVADRTRTIMNNLQGSSAEAMLSIISDPGQRGLASSLMQMLAESPVAVREFLDQRDQPTGQALARMLSNINTSYDAERIMTTVPAAYRTQFLAMYADPEQRVATRHLFSLLGSEAPGAVTAATNLMTMLAAGDTQVGRDGRQLLAMLSGSPQERSRAELMISTLRTPNQIRSLFELERTPAARDLILERLASNEERQERARELLTPLAGTEAQLRNRFLAMLANPTQRMLATIMLDTLNPDARNAMVTILDTPSQAATARMFSTLLQGSPTERMNVRLLLDPANGIGTRMRGMLLNESSRPVAMMALQVLNEPTQMNSFLDLMTDNSSRSTAHVRQMLLSGETAQTSQAKTLLSLWGSNRSAGRALLNMLNTPTEAQRARAILSAGPDAERLHRSLNDGGAVGTALLAMFNNPDQRSRATELYRNLDDGQIAQVLSMLNSPETRPAGEYLLSMVGNEERPRLVRQMLELTGSPSGARVLRMLADPTSDDFDIAHNLSSIGNANIAPFLDVIRNDAHRHAANELISMIRPGDYNNSQAVSRLMTMLTSASTRQEGERLLAMIGDSRHRSAAIRQLDNMIDRQNPSDFEGLIKK